MRVKVEEKIEESKCYDVSRLEKGDMIHVYNRWAARYRKLHKMMLETKDEIKEQRIINLMGNLQLQIMALSEHMKAAFPKKMKRGIKKRGTKLKVRK